MLTSETELPLVVAILLRRRIFLHLDLPLLCILLRQPPTHQRTGQHIAVLRIQLSRMSGLWTPYWHDRLLDSVRVCEKNIQRDQGGLKQHTSRSGMEALFPGQDRIT